MIGRYPRYRELWERYRATCDRPEGPEGYFVTRDYADLQVLSQLAWFDEYFLAEPDVAALVKKGEDFSRDDQQLVIAKEREILAKVLPAYAEAAQRGSIELSATPYYHPILPLLCDTNVGAQSAPGLSLPTRHFRRPEDASLQIQRALDSHQALFGVRPKGLWPSEGSVSEEAVMLAARQGIEWMATDEGVLGRSLDFNFARDGPWPSLGRRRGAAVQHLPLREGRHADAHGLPRPSPLGSHRLCVLGDARSGSCQSPAREHQEFGAAGARTREGRRGFDHPRRRECVGVLPEIGPRVPAPLLRCVAA